MDTIGGLNLDDEMDTMLMRMQQLTEFSGESFQPSQVTMTLSNSIDNPSPPSVMSWSNLPSTTISFSNNNDIITTTPMRQEEEQDQTPKTKLLKSATNGAKTYSMKNNSVSAMREMIFMIAAMQPIHIDSESVKPPKRRNVKISKDPQSVAARLRRERISERIKILQRMVPGGTKMDTASMLDEAIHYVKFLKTQVQSLERFTATNNRNGFPYFPLPRPYQASQIQTVDHVRDA